MRAVALAGLCAALAACAGLPVGGHTFLVIGLGVVRLDRADRAIGIRSITLGARIGCDGVTLGVDSSFCALLPADGSVAILEQGSRPREHLVVRRLPKEQSQ